MDMKGKYLPFTGREPFISNNAPDLILLLMFNHTKYVKIDLQRCLYLHFLDLHMLLDNLKYAL